MTAAQWKLETWHAFGAALRTDEETDEVELLIWDPASAERRSNGEQGDLNDFIEIQQRLFHYCAAQFNVTRVWLGGPKAEMKKEMEEHEAFVDNDDDDEECMKVAGLWVHDCLRDFKATLPKSEEDLKALGYHLLHTKRESI